MRKKILIGGISVLVIGIGFLWYLGGQREEAGQMGRLVVKQVAQSELNKTNPADKAKVLALNAIIGKNAPLATPSHQIMAASPRLTAEPLIIDQETPNTPTLYGQALVSALRPYLESNTQNLLRVLVRYIEKPNPTDLEILKQAANGLDGSLRLLPLVAIPRTTLRANQNLTVHLTKLEQLVRFMSQVETEPIQALQAGQLYPTEQLAATKALLDINQYFKDRQVKFPASTTPAISLNL